MYPFPPHLATMICWKANEFLTTDHTLLCVKLQGQGANYVKTSLKILAEEATRSPQTLHLVRECRSRSRYLTTA